MSARTFRRLSYGQLPVLNSVSFPDPDQICDVTLIDTEPEPRILAVFSDGSQQEVSQSEALFLLWYLAGKARGLSG